MFSGIALANAADQGPNDVAALKKEVTTLQAKVMELEQKLENKQASAMTIKPQAAAPVSPSTTFDASDPFAEMEAMQERINAIMSSQLNAGFGPGSMGISRMPMAGASFSFHPDYDIKATDKAYIVTFDMPGMDKSKINVEVKEGALNVSGERSSENKESDGNRVYRQERSFGYFSRAIPLPGDAKADSVQAKYDNGVLTVTVDKKETAPKAPDKSQKIEVK
jgi:HSP20 family protein